MKKEYPAQLPTPRIQNLRTIGALNGFPIGSGARSNVGGLNNSAQLIQQNRIASLNENAYSSRLDGNFADTLNGYVRYSF